jgi:hypothetical protein
VTYLERWGTSPNAGYYLIRWLMMFFGHSDGATDANSEQHHGQSVGEMWLEVSVERLEGLALGNAEEARKIARRRAIDSYNERARKLGLPEISYDDDDP